MMLLCVLRLFGRPVHRYVQQYLTLLDLMMPAIVDIDLPRRSGSDLGSVPTVLTVSKRFRPLRDLSDAN